MMLSTVRRRGLFNFAHPKNPNWPFVWLSLAGCSMGNVPETRYINVTYGTKGCMLQVQCAILLTSRFLKSRHSLFHQFRFRRSTERPRRFGLF